MSKDNSNPEVEVPRPTSPVDASPVVHHLSLARDAAKLARQAFDAYELYARYGEIDGEDGDSELWAFRRYLARGRMHVLLACEELGLPAIVSTVRDELFGVRAGTKPTIARAGAQGHEVLSPDLWHLEDWIDALQARAGQAITSSVGEYQRNQLLALLGDTAHLVKRRDVIPDGELAVQGVMHDYLRACFPDFTPKPVVPWPTKTFKPDGGIPSLKCAIEFKYARTSGDVARSIDQIFADAQGYTGDGQWQRFVLVYYMTSAVAQPSAIRATFRLAGLSAWDVIVKVGQGT